MISPKHMAGSSMPQNIKKYTFLLIPFCIVLGLNIYFRSFPIFFPQLKTRAREVIYQLITQNIARDVYAKFPQFNPLAKDKVINSRVSEYKKLNAKIINKQIQEGYTQLKGRFQDESGQTYLMELDCWHWAKYVDNVLKLGHPGDKVENGRQIDSLMEAPQGSK
ncbi:MAG: hypothetical protein NT066_01275, partial [Candidatus Omnitrophica bacterium]|nr:hypothetical protein [Candidatus Omnitrophota bacterium]